jgi:hypothetical protein
MIMFLNYLNSILICVLFLDMFERRFPVEFNNKLINISFKLIHFYSKIQLFFIKANKQLDKIMNSNQTLLKIKNDIENLLSYNSKSQVTIEFIKNGEIIDFINDKNFDFIIHSCFDKENNCLNKKIIYDEEGDDEDEIICSDVKFILVELKIGDNLKFKIDLKTNEYNYYLVGNKFTKNFFIYYLKNYLKVNDYVSFGDKMILKIIDSNVETFEIDLSNKCLLLRKQDWC